MPISPDSDAARAAHREKMAGRMLAYLQRMPLSTERRLELALEVLRTLPEDASSELALTTLREHLPQLDPSAYPADHPEIRRGHMPGQNLGRFRTGIRSMLARWNWLLFLALLLGLTLLLNYPR